MPDSNDPLAQSLALVQQAQKGDAQAMDALFKRYGPRVLQIARVRLGPGLRAKLESQDIAQEALLRAFKGFENFEMRHEGAFLHWLSKTVDNVIRDQHDYFHAQKRASSQECPLSRPDGSAGDRIFRDLAGPDRTPSRQAAAREDFERLLSALDRLPEDSREAIVQRDLEGLSFAEIGAILERSEDAARMFYARAKARLAAMMQDP